MDKFPKFYIYRLTFESGSTYVGQHIQYKENDKYISSSSYFKNHPEDKLIKRDILIYLNDRDTLDIFETILICQDKAENPKNVNYNLGQWNTHFYRGGWNKGIPHSKEHREKISKNSAHTPSWLKGKHLDNATKEKISNSLKGRIPPNKGKKASEATKEKMSKSHKGKPHSAEWNKKVGDAQRGKPKSREAVMNNRMSHQKYFKKVLCIEDNLEFDSMKACSRYYGVSSIEICIKKHNGFYKKINKHFKLI